MNALEEAPKDAMDVLEDLMSKRQWKKQCLRANVAQPEDIVAYGTVKVAKIYSNVLKKGRKSQSSMTLSRISRLSGGERTPR